MSAPQRTLLAELRRDREAMTRHRDRTAELLAEAPFDATQWRPLTLLASTIDAWYSAFEAIAERVSRAFEGLPERGADWHRRLLEASTLDIEGVRPPLVPLTRLLPLRELLGLRHVHRHAYHIDLDPTRLVELGHVLVATHDAVREDLDLFESHIRAALTLP